MKRMFIVLAVLPMLLAAAPQGRPSSAPAATQAAVIAKDATGLALVEISSAKEVDNRPSDGNLVAIVACKIVNSTGTTATDLRITKAYGGRRIAAPPALKSPLLAVDLAAGQRYYLEFGPTSDAYPEGVLACWPEKSVPAEVPTAIAADRFG